MLNVQERRLILKLHEEGKTQEYISGLIGCSQPTVHRWIQYGMQGRTLETLPRSGRPTPLTKNRLGKLRCKILEKVKARNKNYCSVSTKEIKRIIDDEIGRVYTLRHVERLMHKLGFSLIKPRPQHTRHDQSKVDKFRDEFKKNSHRSIWVMKS